MRHKVWHKSYYKRKIVKFDLLIKVKHTFFYITITVVTNFYEEQDSNLFEAITATFDKNLATTFATTDMHQGSILNLDYSMHSLTSTVSICNNI